MNALCGRICKRVFTPILLLSGANLPDRFEAPIRDYEQAGDLFPRGRRPFLIRA